MATEPDLNQGTERTDDRSVGELVLDVSEKTSTLVREEIALAKAEVSEKVDKLIKGSVVGIAAGVFLLLFLAMLMHAIAWLLNDLFFEDTVWLGFLLEALFWLLVAGLAGLVAYRSIQAGAPPTPDMAIEEAKLARETFEGKDQEPSQGTEQERPREGQGR
jgi:Putative Actinobacterial Holin-X, holin superfamily III